MPEIEEAVMEYILRYINIYQEEIIDFLYNEFGIQPYQSIILRLLKKLEVIYKKIKAVVAEQNQELLK